MTRADWILLKTVYNIAESEVIKGMLEAQEIKVLLEQEGAAKAIGLNVGSLGEIQILVKSSDKELANEVLSDFLSGNMEADD